jgi:hypothetical protein
MLMTYINTRGCGWVMSETLCGLALKVLLVTSSYLPPCEAGLAQQVSAGLDACVLVSLCTDLTQLEGTTHLTVHLVLVLCDFDPASLCWFTQTGEVWVHITSVRVKIAADKTQHRITHIM